MKAIETTILGRERVDGLTEGFLEWLKESDLDIRYLMVERGLVGVLRYYEEWREGQESACYNF